MLQAYGLSYEPDPRIGPLFENLSLSIRLGERVVLTGRNGTGKTKLLEILGGQIAPCSGHVVLKDGTTLGYLPQDLDLGFDGTQANLVGDTPTLRRVLPRLGIGKHMLAQRYETLSLGERTRAHLALALNDDPDILLLDEPTNHLDLQGRIWLEETLRNCRQGVLIVTHDRATIDALAHRVLELDRGILREYAGGYQDMKRAQRLEREKQQETYERQSAEAKRLLMSAERTMKRAKQVAGAPSKGTYDPFLAPFYKAKAARMDKRAQSIRTRVEQARASHVDKPWDEQETDLVFPSRPLRNAYPLIVRGLSKTYGRRIFEGLNLTLERNGRLAIIGPNGSGKTTLFRILLGDEMADAGSIQWCPDAVVSYLSQDRATLPMDRTLIEAIDPQNSDEETFVRTLLARLRMRREDVGTRIGDLSVGERTKAEIVSMLRSPANVLILDEPTNHLDIASLEALEEALLAFPGCVLFTSHDRSFVERIATDVVTLP